MGNNLKSSHGQVVYTQDFTDLSIRFSGPAYLELRTHKINLDVPQLVRTERVCRSPILSSPLTPFFSLFLHLYFPLTVFFQLMTQAST